MFIGDCVYKKIPVPLWKRILQRLNPFWWYGRWRSRKFTKVVFPVVNRVYPVLLAKDLVEIQPMTAPTTGLFDIDYRYESTKEKK